jgi:hypothetical protein
MNGVNTITKQALHHLAGQRLVSIQEAIHMVSNQELVISSNKMTYFSLAQRQALRDECDMHAKKDLRKNLPFTITYSGALSRYSHRFYHL